MSDYSRIHDFTAKDALLTGNPLKLIKGSEVDAEFDALVTAVATKIDEPASPSEGDILIYTSGAWAASAGGAAPPGAVMPYAGATLPTNWLFCDGSSIATATYPALFAAIAYVYGGSGANFSLPDLRGRSAFGKDDMNNAVGTGGGAASRMTTSIDGDALGASGGSQTHTLTSPDEIPSHTHTATSSPAVPSGSTNVAGAGINGWSGNGAGATTPTVTVNATGSGGAHENTPPGLILNYIIRT